MLAQLRIIKHLYDLKVLDESELAKLADYLVTFASILLLEQGGHSYKEMMSVLGLPQVKEAFKEIIDFNGFHYENLLLKDGVVEKPVLDNCCNYINSLMKKERVHGELLKTTPEVEPIKTDEEANHVLNQKANLIRGAHRGELNTVRDAIKSGVSLDSPYKDGRTALMFAAARNHTNITNELIKNKCNINLASKAGETALFFAVANGHVQMVKELIKNGAHVNIANNKGITPLMYAAVNGHMEILNELIKHGADVNALTTHSDTALMYAASKGHHKIVQKLLDSKSKVNLTNLAGDTAFDIAVRANHASTIKLLEGAQKKEVSNQARDSKSNSLQTQASTIVDKNNIVVSKKSPFDIFASRKLSEEKVFYTTPFNNSPKMNGAKIGSSIGLLVGALLCIPVVLSGIGILAVPAILGFSTILGAGIGTLVGVIKNAHNPPSVRTEEVKSENVATDKFQQKNDSGKIVQIGQQIESPNKTNFSCTFLETIKSSLFKAPSYSSPENASS